MKNGSIGHVDIQATEAIEVVMKVESAGGVEGCFQGIVLRWPGGQGGRDAGEEGDEDREDYPGHSNARINRRSKGSK